MSTICNKAVFKFSRAFSFFNYKANVDKGQGQKWSNFKKWKPSVIPKKYRSSSKKVKIINLKAKMVNFKAKMVQI